MHKLPPPEAPSAPPPKAAPLAARRSRFRSVRLARLDSFVADVATAA